MTVGRILDQPTRTVGIGQIDRMKGDVEPLAQGSELRCLCAAANHDVRAFTAECLGDGQADAFAASSDDGDLVREIQLHRILLRGIPRHDKATQTWCFQ